MGFVLDLYVEYLARVMIRLFKRWNAQSWDIVTAKVTSTRVRGSGFGCAVADMTYNYRYAGELFTGTDANPFVWHSSAERYLEDYPRGSELLVRVRPQNPALSVVRQDDLYRKSHGYRLAAK